MRFKDSELLKLIPPHYREMLIFPELQLILNPIRAWLLDNNNSQSAELKNAATVIPPFLTDIKSRGLSHQG